MVTLVVYFCGISRKFNLDYSTLIPFNHKLKNEAKVKGRWYEKVEKRFRMVLGSNIGSFHTEQEAFAYATKNFKQISVRPYDAVGTTGSTSWQLRE